MIHMVIEGFSTSNLCLQCFFFLILITPHRHSLMMPRAVKLSRTCASVGWEHRHRWLLSSIRDHWRGYSDNIDLDSMLPSSKRWVQSYFSPFSICFWCTQMHAVVMGASIWATPWENGHPLLIACEIPDPWESLKANDYSTQTKYHLFTCSIDEPPKITRTSIWAVLKKWNVSLNVLISIMCVFLVGFNDATLEPHLREVRGNSEFWFILGLKCMTLINLYCYLIF